MSCKFAKKLGIVFGKNSPRRKKKWSCDQDGGLHECDAPPAGLAALAGDADLDMAEKALLRSEEGGLVRAGTGSEGVLLAF